MQQPLMNEHDFDSKDLCMELLRYDTESEVIDALKRVGLWDDPDAWRPYGDAEDNFATIGNQQSASAAALVEKVVNSIDAVLTRACMAEGVEPESSSAPQSTAAAVAQFYGGDSRKVSTLGHIGAWDSSKRTEMARMITLAATGSRRIPSFTIVDQGEGQTPDSFPDTLLSLHKQNKMRIRFVQGKFNMGGTGALQFCGHDNIQLIISKRSPGIPNNGRDDESWGFTVVRRENPEDNRRLSMYTYLAPMDANHNRNRGGVLRFHAPSLFLMPERNNPYARSIEWGTAVKLYEYQAQGFRSHILRGDGLLQKLEILLPEPALPIRLHECRNYEGTEASFDTTLAGLSVRLQDDRANNLEEGFPTTAHLEVANETMSVKIYAFKPRRATTYRKGEGIVFSINGQAHGNIPATFFSRTAVGMDRLADSILVMVDCSQIEGRNREDLFLNSRDRLRDNELRAEIERELVQIIKNHQSLKALRERRRREETEKVMGDNSLQSVLDSVIRTSPAFASLFGQGSAMANPFNLMATGSTENFVGKRFPTFFRIHGSRTDQVYNRQCPINSRFRIPFETDAENEYFGREVDPGQVSLMLDDHMGKPKSILNLINGTANLTVSLPEEVRVGDQLSYMAAVSDTAHVLPIGNSFTVTVVPARTSTSGAKERRTQGRGGEGADRETPSRLALPTVVPVRMKDWSNYNFDKFSVLGVIDEGVESQVGDSSSSPYTFYLNVDNQYLGIELKQRSGDPKLIRKRWECGLILIGLGLIHEWKTNPPNDEDGELFGQFVSRCSRALAPVVMPLVESIAAIDFTGNSDAEDESEDFIADEKDTLI